MDPIKVDFSGKGRPTEVVIPPEKKVLKIIIAIHYYYRWCSFILLYVTSIKP